VVRELMKNHPEEDIQLVIGLDIVGHNPKVNNLHNMLAYSKYDCIVIMDSDIRVGPDFLASVVPELSDERVGLVTCFYKAGKAPNLASKLESVGITGEFAPGVLIAQLGEGMTFSLGAVMATTKEKLRSIGGFHAIADFLADDYMLGNLLWKAGYEIRLSHYVVQTIHPHATLKGMIKHQIRWGRGIKACRPMGHLGSVVTHGTTLALINMALAGGSLWSILLLIAAAGTQLTMGRLIGVRFLEDDILKENLWLLPLRDLLSFGIWCASLVGREVEWRGERFRLLNNGKMVPVDRYRIADK